MSGRKLRMWLCAMVVALGIALPTMAWAQFEDDDDMGPASTQSAPAEEKSPLSYRAGNLELMLGGNMNGLLFPEVEIGVELGFLPLTDGVVLSLGGSAGAGYCLGCFLFDFLSQGALEIRASSYSILGRAGVHLPLLGEMFDVPELDVSAGLMAGPSFYSASFSFEDGSGSATYEYVQPVFSIGPYAALRYMFGDSFFVGFDARYFIAFADETVTFDINGTEYTVDTQDFIRADVLYNGYIGVRF